ncbi:MAG: molybdopterin-synthase adenylyltransferase MoeB [Myxococcales bacterium]|nr:molybdopterin-synthase adenylyltransferase MoeB [Myxococcales bacterium]HIK83696.1 molybdopterin-synthase adenylyltransferase MoeB [Myxococcales bacterium]
MQSEGTPLRPDQFDRYRRHLALPEIGLEGQQKLLLSSVLLIGAGGLGCPAAQYLTAAGVGRMGLVDDDVVSASNLQRQILYSTTDIGRPKVEVARERLSGLNPDVKIDIHPLRLDSTNALELFSDYDVIVDGTDNFPTRYLTNDACVLLGKPNVHGSIFRFEGQASVFDASKGPCYRCLYPEPPPPGAVPSCAEGGVLGILPGTIALVQATETLKILTGLGEPLYGRLLHYDALEMAWREFKMKKDPGCLLCGDNPEIRELIDYEGFCGMPAREGEALGEIKQCSAAHYAERRDAGDSMLLLDVREQDEVETARIEGAHWIPLGELEARRDELEGEEGRVIIVHCHLGGRSTKAVRLLQELGFSNVENFDGGIEAWSLTVDASIPRYGGGS